MKKLLQLLWAMLKVGCIGFGGGNALIPFIEKEVVKKDKLVTTKEFNKFIVAANITPGALPVEIAVTLGKTVAGIPGMLLAPVCIALPGVFATLCLVILFAQISNEAILQVKYLSVGISGYIIYLLYKYSEKAVMSFELNSMKLKRLAVILCVCGLTCGKEIYNIFGISGTPIFDVSTVDVLLLSFFVIFSTGKGMTKARFVFDAVIALLYVLCVGKANIISSEVVLNILRIIMLAVSVWGIYESFSDRKELKIERIKTMLKEEIGLFVFWGTFVGIAMLFCGQTLSFVLKGYVSSLISFGGGEAYLTVVESMFLEKQIDAEQLYSQLLPVVNALPGSILVKLLSGIGFYQGMNATGSVGVAIMVALAGFATGIAASGAVVCAIMFIYEMFEDLKIFGLLGKCIRPIVGGLLLSTALSLFYQVQKIMHECGSPVWGSLLLVIGIFVFNVLMKKIKKIPEGLLVVFCGMIGLIVCNVIVM